MTDAVRSRIPWIFAALLVVCGALGWFAAFNLTLDKFIVLENKDAVLSCDVSPFVTCSKNLGQWQGAVFGFPNPLLGLGGFVAPIAVGVALLAGARFTRWFWIAFNVGVALAFAFCAWLLSQSFYAANLGTICLWCVLVWTVTIPLFVVTTARNLDAGVWGERARPAGSFLLRWAPLIVVLLYVVVAVLAQARFSIIQFLVA